MDCPPTARTKFTQGRTERSGFFYARIKGTSKLDDRIGVESGVKRVTFIVACLGTAIVLRLWVRGHPEVMHLRAGWVALGLSVVWGWWVLVRWRFCDPELAYSLLGICAALGGAGLYMVVTILIPSISWIWP